MKSNRLRIYQVREDDVLMLLNWAKRAPQYVSIPEMSGVPDGAEVEAIHPSYEYRSLHVLVSHPSFPEVPQGERVPIEPRFVDMRVYSVAIKPS